MLAIRKPWEFIAQKTKVLRGFSFWKNVSEHLQSKNNYERGEEALRLMWARMSKDWKIYLSTIEEVSGNVEAKELDEKPMLETVGDFYEKDIEEGGRKNVVPGIQFKYGVVAENLQKQPVWLCFCKKEKEINIVDSDAGNSRKRAIGGDIDARESNIGRKPLVMDADETLDEELAKERKLFRDEVVRLNDNLEDSNCLVVKLANEERRAVVLLVIPDTNLH